jgi:[calcium/calmodulin-dependent protein kinase] kinase
MASPRTPEPDASQRRSLREPAVQHTHSATLRSDARGNAYLNQYVVIKDLGRGAFGKVKLCLNSQTNELCALKCINRKLLRRKYAGQGRDKGAQAVRKEIAIMKKLSHPNVVRLREVIDDESGQYIFMALEYVPGGPLYDPARYDGKGMGEDLARKYFRSTLVGLAYLHAAGIIHRDLKPDNLLKHADGTVKISDFGVSELFEEATNESLTSPGTPTLSSPGTSGDNRAPRTVRAAVGTPAFLAPEIARGGAARGEPSDVWSLGVCLFYIVTGDVPFPGSTVESVVAKITDVPGDGDGGDGDGGDGDGETPSSRAFLELLNRRGASDSLTDLLRRVLDKNPETRIDLPAIATHAWVTNDGENPLDLGVDDDDDDDEKQSKSPRVSLDISDRDVADSISYERVRGFFDESVAVVRTFKRGEFLIKQGEKGDEMFVILSGEVEVVTLRGGGVGAGGAGDDDRDDEVDMSDDILAAAMMNREFEEEEDDEDEDATAKKGETRPGWLACCFGGSTRAAGRSGPPSLGDPDRLEVVHRSAPSAHALIATRRAGDVVGEMSLLTAGASSARSASVRASSQEVRCSVISKEELWRSLRERPEVLEELRLRSVGRESELIVGRALLRTGSAATMSPGAAEARRGESSHPRE